MSTLPVSYPLSPAAISGDTLSLDLMLSEPTRISAFLSDITLRRMFSPRIFTAGGELSGGTLIYNQLTSNQLFLSTGRDVQQVAPGAEFPIVTGDRLAPKVAVPVKVGGKYFVLDEAVKRNDASAVQLESTMLANNIAKYVDTAAITELDAQLTANSRTLTGTSWSAAKALGAGSVTKAGSPINDFAKAQLKADVDELGVEFNLWIVNPAQYADFVITYGAENVAAVLNASGVNMISSNRVTAGTAYVLQEGAVGQLRVESPLTTETWREHGTQKTWVQSSVSFALAVTNPFSALKVSGLT